MRILFAATLLAAPVAAHAENDPAATRATAARAVERLPSQLSEEQRAGYRMVFAAIREARWADAQIQLNAMAHGPLHSIALTELYSAKGSPKVELEPLMKLLGEAPELPKADLLARLAKVRGAVETPALPATYRLVWQDAAPVRQRARTIKSDTAATEVALAIQPFVKEDRGAEAEALVESKAALLTPEALTEWRQKVAWIYYVAGDDANARRMAGMAQQGSGEWAPQADWVQGLAAWRQKDCVGAQAAFQTVAQRAADTELRSAGLYWASRADIACGRPDLVEGRLRQAAQYRETFYGLLARQQLGLEDPAQKLEPTTADWRLLERRPNVRVAAALVEIGETRLADEVIKHQARLNTSAEEHAALTRLAARMSLPATQLWLSHNCPAGFKPVTEARYPVPAWTPAGGWRVDKALVFAHTLQESRFNAEVKSAAGAMGLMQVKTGAAVDVSRRTGFAGSDLTNPATNMEIGQSYLEQLRDQPFSQGLLPKVIAAYNAGPTPVTAWNSLIRDGNDPLLYIESIPYWETRGYVMIVLRNYWMYEKQEGRNASPSRAALAQGQWPKFPGLPTGKQRAALESGSVGGY